MLHVAQYSTQNKISMSMSKNKLFANILVTYIILAQA